MRAISGTLQAYLSGPGGRKFRVLFWLTAKDRSTGAAVTFGFWNGDDNQNFTINGVSRLYYGAGQLALPGPITYQTGIAVNVYTLPISPLSSQAISALMTYDARMAPVEIHRAAFDPLTDNLIEEPMRMLKGQIEEAPIITPEIGGQAKCELKIATSAVFLTKRLTQTKSHATQLQRSLDGFNRYGSVSGQVTVLWGAQ
jgi:hypothetical protein